MSDLFTSITGTFYRAVDAAHLGSALSGSRRPGRYSSAEQPSLYLSASVEGVEAAMTAHTATGARHLQLIRVHVRAENIFDLRDPHARTLAGISLEDATAPWQSLVAQGKRPASWDLRDRLERLGALGLIDPSRRAPGLWHLVLFDWNKAGVPLVQRID